MGGKPLNKPIVGIAPTPNGNGYYEVASGGGVFAFPTTTAHPSWAAEMASRSTPRWWPFRADLSM
jgi:hypothetical protein